MKVVFLGLGVMGFAMAKHLQHQKFILKVWNRNPLKVDLFGQTYLSLLETVMDADFIISCLGDDDSVKEIGNKILPKLKPNSIWIDHSTISADLTQELFKQSKAYKVHFLEAPVTGGQAGAEFGKLTIMCGGEYEIFNKSKPILEHYALKLEYFGNIGSGQRAKMVNQIAIAGIIQSLAEAIDFAKKSNLDATKLLSFLSDGSASSWQMKNRSNVMISQEYKENIGFPAEWMLKDLKICIEEGKKNHANLELTNLIQQKYEQVIAQYSGRFDASSLILLLQ